MSYIEEKAKEVQEHFDKLLMFAKNNADKDAYFMEKELFQKLLKLGLTFLEIYIESVGTGNVGKKIELDNGEELKHKETRTTIHTTIFGELVIPHEYYYRAGEGGVFPLDSKLNLPERTYSYLLERFSMGVAVNDSYDESRRYIDELFGISLPQSSIQMVSRKSSAYFEEYYESKEIEPIKQGALTVISADGKGLPMKGNKSTENKKRLGRGEKNGKKKMALVGTVYNVKPQYEAENRSFKPQNKKVWAFLEDKERTMSLIEKDIESRLKASDNDNDLLFIADGARGLWGLKKKYFPDAVEILDWYHMSEYLWKAVYVFYPEGSEEAADWIDKMEDKIISGKVTDVIKGLRVRISKNKIKWNKLKTLKSVIDYFENNKKRMNYDEYIKKGYPIGSGNVESACRYLVKDRMEKTGMRWKIPGAQSILSLRATYINNDLNNYWEYYMKNENSRLYGNMRKTG
jgi:hypothetical protein